MFSHILISSLLKLRSYSARAHTHTHTQSLYTQPYIQHGAIKGCLCVY